MKWNGSGLREKLRRAFQPSHSAFLYRNRGLLLLALPLLCGLLTGVLLCRCWSGETGSGISELIGAFLKRRSSPLFWTEFAYSFESVFIFFSAICFCGVSLVGAVLIPAVLLLRGIGLGTVLGGLYCGYGMGGILYSAFLLLPFSCMTSLILLVMAREGIRFSGKMFHSLCREEGGSLRRSFGRYCVRSGIMMILLCGAALTDSALNLLLGGIFRIGAAA